jgi:hypothetical protein
MINWEWALTSTNTCKVKLIKYATIPCISKSKLTLPLFKCGIHNGNYSDGCISYSWQVVYETYHMSCGDSVGCWFGTNGNVEGGVGSVTSSLGLWRYRGWWCCVVFTGRWAPIDNDRVLLCEALMYPTKWICFKKKSFIQSIHFKTPFFFEFSISFFVWQF